MFGDWATVPTELVVEPCHFIQWQVTDRIGTTTTLTELAVDGNKCIATELGQLGLNSQLTSALPTELGKFTAFRALQQIDDIHFSSTLSVALLRPAVR